MPTTQATPAPRSTHRLLQVPSRGGWREVGQLDEGARYVQKNIADPRFADTHAGQIAARKFKQGLKALLSLLTKATLLSPVLLIIKMIWSIVDPVQSELVVVAFVLLVVAFFATFNIFVVWSLVVHLIERRAPKEFLGAYEGDVEDIVPSGATLIEGRVRSVDGASGPLIADHWALNGDESFRLLETQDFAIETRDGTSVFMRCTSAPILLASPRRHSLNLDSQLDLFRLVAHVTERKRADVKRVELREGAHVRVWATNVIDIDNMTHIDLGEGIVKSIGEERVDDPYRQASVRRGRLVRVDAATIVYVV